MTVVDTSVWVDYFNGVENRETDLLHQLLLEEPVVMGDLILIEILQGFRSDKDFELAKSLLSPLPFFHMVGKDIALQSANNYRALRKQGVTVRKTIDVIICTFCIENDMALLHSDNDFGPMEESLGLRTI